MFISCDYKSYETSFVLNFVGTINCERDALDGVKHIISRTRRQQRENTQYNETQKEDLHVKSPLNLSAV